MQFADWALNVLIEVFAYIYTDKFWIKIEGTQGRQKIMCLHGSNHYDLILSSYKFLFTLMLFTCVSLGHKGTLYIWEKETKKESIANAEKLKAENEAKAQQIAEK